MNRQIISFAFGSMILGCGLAMAEGDQFEIELYDQSVGGKPSVCGVQFTHIFQDKLSDVPGIGGSTGSINFTIANGAFVAFVKVVATKDAKQIPVIIAALKADGKYISLKSTGCNDTRNFCGAAYNEDGLQAFTGLASGHFEVRYQTLKSGLDYSTPIVLRLAKNNPDEKKDWDSCIEYLGSQLRRP